MTRRYRLVFAPIVAGAVTACLVPDSPGDRGAGTGHALPTELWFDVTAERLDSTGEWSNKVELADLNGDGSLDLLFANGGNYSTPGDPEQNRVFFNGGASSRFVERSIEILGDRPDLTRVIKARDVDADGDVDIFVGNTYQTRSRLLLNDGDAGFTDRSDLLPTQDLSLGDVEFGDADGDGDLDLVLADWGPGNNMTNEGGRTRLWINDGVGRFTDETAARMPETLVGFSWDLEFVDVDNDLDLDVVVSCKRCPGSLLFSNDGAGHFEEDRRGLPQYTNNYELEPMDVDGDGYLDLVTINDGEIVGERGFSRREHVFRNNGEGRFRDATDVLWPDAENIGEDDNMVSFLDYDSDGDADFLIASLSGPDRLMVNDGDGRLRVATEVFVGADTPGTLGMAIGDLDGDGRIDVVQSQGEHPEAVQERIHLGRGLAPDTAPPVVTLATIVEDGAELLVRARIHDRKSPTLPTEWARVEVLFEVMDAARVVPMMWYGEYLWRASILPEAHDVEICATDASGNTTCVEVPDPTL